MCAQWGIKSRCENKKIRPATSCRGPVRALLICLFEIGLTAGAVSYRRMDGMSLDMGADRLEITIVADFFSVEFLSLAVNARLERFAALGAFLRLGRMPPSE